MSGLAANHNAKLSNLAVVLDDCVAMLFLLKAVFASQVSSYLTRANVLSPHSVEVIGKAGVLVRSPVVVVHALELDIRTDTTLNNFFTYGSYD